MKNAQIILAMILFITPGFHAQQSGKVHYEEVMTMDLPIPDHLPEDLRQQIPSQRVNHFNLTYNQKESLYTNTIGKGSGDTDISTGDEDNEFQLRIRTPEFNIYTNRVNKKYLEERDFMGRKFLINAECEKIDWKITSEQKTVMDIPCLKAISSESIVAWFAPSIKAPHGPVGYGDLPGLILAMEFPENNRKILAIAIDDIPIQSEDFEIPSKGKKVSREKFDEIVEKKMKEMGSQGEDGLRIIMIEEEN